MRLFFAFLFALSSTLATAHSWYPPFCCSDQDCHPIVCNELVGSGDAIIYRGVTFGKNTIRPSMDDTCHVCISKAGKGLCVFTLPST